MLPEALSAGLCSLREKEDRACLAVRMVFDRNGRKIAHRFERGLMRSAAKLAYGQAQAAIDGALDEKSGPLLEPILKPLWAAYACLVRARDVRSPLDIDSPERRIRLNEDGEVVEIQKRERLDAHRLIEEMMIQANVCAAETLEEKRSPLIYRIHDTPSDEKMLSLGDFLATIGMSWSKGEAPKTERFNRLLGQTREGPHAEIVNEVVLRSQMQAQYSPDNIGHFGLNLERYAHFTSPIRRYADLIVHRALIRTSEASATDGLTDRRDRAACPPPPTTSLPPSAPPWPPSATPPTDTWPPSCPNRVGAEFRRAASPASPASACSFGSMKPGRTGWFRCRSSARSISSTTTRRTRWSASGRAHDGGLVHGWR